MWTCAENLTLTGIRSPNRPARIVFTSSLVDISCHLTVLIAADVRYDIRLLRYVLAVVGRQLC